MTKLQTPNSKRLLIVLTLVIGIWSLGFTSAFAAVNAQVNYQGRLVTPTNIAVPDGSYNMRFNLYTAASGGVSLWAEADTGTNRVQVVKGLFSIMLGSTTPFIGVDWNQTLYLGVEIGGTNLVTPTWDGEMTPRKILGTVPAAFTAVNVIGTTASTTNALFTNATTTNATTTYLFAQNATFGNILSTSQTITNLIFGLATGTAATTTNFFSSIASSTSLFATSFNFGSGLIGLSTTSQATTTSFFATTASSTNLFASTAIFTNLLANASSTFQNITFLNSTSTNATTTNFFAQNASTTNLFWASGQGTSTSIFATTASSTNLFSANANLGLATFVNSTTSSATTTNLFATNASTTNLRANTATIGTETIGNLISTNSTSTNATTSQLAITSLTAGSVPFVGTGGRIADNNGQLFWDNSQTFLGIGITNPTQKLQVSGGVALFDTASVGAGANTTSGIRIVAPIASTHFNWMIGAQQNVSGGFEITPSTATGGTTFSTPAITVLSGGNVGVGTTNPSKKFMVQDGTTGQEIARFTGTGTAGTYLNWDESGVKGWYLGIDDNTTTFKIREDGLTGATALSILAGGNVGIGQTNPGEKLVVKGGTVSTTFGASSQVRLDSGSSGQRSEIHLTDGVTSDAFLSFLPTSSSATQRLGFGVTTEAVSILGSGNVGIGVTNPGTKLAVSGQGTIATFTSTGAGAAINIDDLATSGGKKWAYGDDVQTAGIFTIQQFGNAAANSFNIDTSGNVGIGITNPAVSLAVVGTQYVGNFNKSGTYKALSLGASGNGYGAIGYGITFTGGGLAYNYANSDFASWIDFDSGKLIFKVAASGTAGNAISPTTAMTILNNANVGIGTTNPGYPLILTKDGTNISGTMNLTALFRNGGQTEGVGLGYDTSGTIGVIAADNSSGNLAFWTHNGSTWGERMKLTAAGKVGIGNTSPSVQLDVVGGASATGANIYGNWTPDGESLIKNWLLNDGSSNWTGYATIATVTDGKVGPKTLRSATAGESDVTSVGWVPIDPSKTYLLGVWVRGSVSNCPVYLAGRQADKDLAYGAWDNGGWGQPYFGLTGTNAPTSWTYYSTTVGPNGASPIQSGAQYMQVGALLNYGSACSGYAEIQGFSMTEVSSGFVYTPGSSANITTLPGWSGNVGIGVTNPAYPFMVQSSSDINTAKFYRTGSPTSDSVVEIRSVGNNTSRLLEAFGNDGALEAAQFMSNGTIRFPQALAGTGSRTVTADSTGSLSASSDERLKDIVNMYTSGLDALRIINPIRYTWKPSSGLYVDRPVIGFSAQNLQQGIPEAVGVDLKGFLTIDDRGILATLVNAAKELDLRTASTSEEVAGLKVDLDVFASSATARIDAVELRVSALEAGSSTGLTISTSTPGFVAAVFEALGATYDNAILYIKTLLVDKLIAKQGVVIYDRVTGEPVCTVMENGVPKYYAGDCNNIPLVISQGSDTGSSTASSTPEAGPETPPSTDTASSTPSTADTATPPSDSGATSTPSTT